MTLVRDTTAETASLQVQLNATNLLLTKKQVQQQLQKEQIAELEEKVAELEVTNNTFTTALSNLDTQQEIVNGDLGRAISASTLPTSVDLTGLTHVGVILTVSGMSLGETEILAYADALRSTDRFSQVTISAIERIGDGIDLHGFYCIPVISNT